MVDTMLESEIELLGYEREIKEIKHQVRLMIRAMLYGSFMLVLFTTINVILRGFREGFY